MCVCVCLSDHVLLRQNAMNPGKLGTKRKLTIRGMSSTDIFPVRTKDMRCTNENVRILAAIVRVSLGATNSGGKEASKEDTTRGHVAAKWVGVKRLRRRNLFLTIFGAPALIITLTSLHYTENFTTLRVLVTTPRSSLHYINYATPRS